MCNQTNSFLSRFPAPSRSFGTQTDAGLVTEDTASNLPQSLNDWGEMTEKPSPFFNGENTAIEEGFVRGGKNGQTINIPTPPNQRGQRRNGPGNNKNSGGPRTEKIQQNQQLILDGPRSELEKWFQSINIMAGPVPQWRTNFSNGYLIAQILEIFFPAEIQSVGFHTGVSSSNKRDNWRQLQAFFLRYDFSLNDNEIMGMMQAKKSSIVPMLLKLHGFLCNQGMVVPFDPDKMGGSKKPNRRTRRSVMGGPGDSSQQDMEYGGYNEMVQGNGGFGGDISGSSNQFGGGFNDINDGQFGGGFDQRPGVARGRR